jgi:hypothetical protein
MNFVMTRSSYGPEWDKAANKRRLMITKAVTARLIARQTLPYFGWVVLLDGRDPFLTERWRIYRDSAPAFFPIIWEPEVSTRQLAADRMPPWRCYLNPNETHLMTRLDDDDGLAPDALERIQRAAKGGERRIYLFPSGVRVWAGWQQAVRHEANAMQTLLTPPGDTLSVYDYTHTEPIAPVEFIDGVGWLWVRHRDTISGEMLRATDSPITDALRCHFPIDWDLLTEVWA